MIHLFLICRECWDVQTKEVAAEKNDALVKPQIKLRAWGTIGQVKAERIADDEVRMCET